MDPKEEPVYSDAPKRVLIEEIVSESNQDDKNESNNLSNVEN